jgi:hypothetical protein
LEILETGNAEVLKAGIILFTCSGILLGATSLDEEVPVVDTFGGLIFNDMLTCMGCLRVVKLPPVVALAEL